MAEQTKKCKIIMMIICVIIFLSTLAHSDAIDMVNITFVDGAVQKEAVCLDGSPAGYHFAEGFGEGCNKWIVLLGGGGWCGSNKSCVNNTRSNIGSTNNSTFHSFSGILSSNQSFNPDFFNWNRVFVRYCDGSLFTGYVEAIDPQNNLHRRGAIIFRAVTDELLARGMDSASDVILTGHSAGGLATIINCDRFRAFVPNATRLKCISDSGFFIRGKYFPGVVERESQFAGVVAFHDLAKSLPTSCTSRMNASLCLFPEYLVGDIQTPLFLLNSAFDSFQIGTLTPYPSDQRDGWNCTVSIDSVEKYCTSHQLQTIAGFRSTFLETLDKIDDGSELYSRGMYIISCYIHDLIYRENWNKSPPSLGNKTIAEAISDWYFERSPVMEIDTESDRPLNCNMDY